MPIKLIIGLRNPGDAYAKTRHNAGGWFVESCARQAGAIFKIDKKLHAELATIEIGTVSCKGILPLNFMNQSGLAAHTTAHFYQIKTDEILVAHDELDLPAGQIRLKSGGGHGGHNGLRDIIKQLGSSDFHRLRIGISHPGHKDLVVNYVLGKPTPTEHQAIINAITRGIAVMPQVLSGNLASAMNCLHGELH